MEEALKHKDPAKALQAVLSAMEYAYQTDMLQHGWYSRAALFFSARANEQWGDVQAARVLPIITSKKKLGKADMVTVVGMALKNEMVFKEFFASLPAYLATILEKLVWEKNMNRETAERIAGTELLEKAVNSWQPPGLKKEFGLFTAMVQGYSYYHREGNYVNVILSLPELLRWHLAAYFPKPAGYYILPVPAPKAGDAVFFNAEASINRELPLLLTYYAQGQIKYSEKGRPNGAGVKKIARVLQLEEFFPDSNFPATRSMLMAGMIWNSEKIPETTTISGKLKEVFTRNFLRISPAHYIFTQLKGLNNFYAHEYATQPMMDMWHVFAMLPSAEWVTIENLHKFMEMHFVDLTPITDWKLTDRVHYEEGGDGDKRHLSVMDFANFVHRPFLAGAAFLFAAFGLLELCYKAPPQTGFGQTWYSEYDGLIAVKLTALGAYVLGTKNEYEAPVSESANRLVLEAGSLLIRVEGNLEIAQVQLGNFAQKASGNRYQFSPGLFLKDCKKKADITNKISLFRQTIGTALPPNWEAYLKTLIANSQLIQRENKMSVFRLPPDNKELHRLLVQDETLKKLIIKAEQYYVLVNESRELMFKARLKELGILLE